MKMYLISQIIIAIHFTQFVRSSIDCYSDKIEIINQRFLRLHNEYRERHLAPQLTLDEPLIRDAVRRAKHLVMNSNFVIPYSNKNIGENQWFYFGDDYFDYEEMNPLQDWYEEMSYYDFDRPEPTAGAGNFTQLVWKETKTLGCGVCNEHSKTFVICRYKPSGNIKNEYKENVKRPVIVNLGNIAMFLKAVALSIFIFILILGIIYKSIRYTWYMISTLLMSFACCLMLYYILNDST